MTWGCNASSACMLSHFSRVRLFVTPRTVARQAPLSMGFSRQGYWRRLPFPPAGDLPDPGLEPTSLTSPALAGGSFTTSAPLGQPVEWNRKKTHVRNGTTDEENKLYFFFLRPSDRWSSYAENDVWKKTSTRRCNRRVRDVHEEKVTAILVDMKRCLLSAPMHTNTSKTCNIHTSLYLNF